MEIQTESTEVLRWDINGIKAEARIESQNAAHTFKGFDTTGSVEGRSTFIVTVDKEDDLKELHKALGELIQHLDQKRGVGRQAEVQNILERTERYYDRLKDRPKEEQELLIRATDRSKQKIKSVSGHDSIQ